VDTENGPEVGHGINLVEPGFNSAWNKANGIWTVAEGRLKGDWASEKPTIW
jgi:hypothetical protein